MTIKTFEEFAKIICEKFLKTHNITTQTITTEEEIKYFNSEDDRSENSVEKIIHLNGFPEFKIRYTNFDKYFLYKISYGQPDVYLSGDENPENLLKVIEALINCGDK